MKITIKGKMMLAKRRPTHPGGILKELYLKPLNLELNSTSKALGIKHRTLLEILQEKKEVTPEIALRLSKAFDTTPDLWLGLQKDYDLWMASQKYENEIKKIPKLYDSSIIMEEEKEECARNPRKLSMQKNKTK